MRNIYLITLLALLFMVGCTAAPEVVPTPGGAGESKAEAGEKAKGEEAGEKYEVVEDKEPEVKAVEVYTPARYWAEAVMDFEQGNITDSLANVIGYRKTNPDHGDARRLETRLRYMTDDAQIGLPLLEQMVEEGEGGMQTIHTYVGWALEKGEPQRALATLEKVMEESLRPRTDLLGVAGWLKAALGMNEEAFELLEEALDEGFGDTYYMLYSRLLYEEGFFDVALETLEEFDAPPTVKGRMLRGDIARAQGRATIARRAYQGLIDEFPGHYGATVNLGILTMGQGDAKGAEAIFSKVAQDNPELPHAWTNKGLALRAQGDYAGAREAYTRALESDPNHPPALKNMGILVEKYLGEPAQGLEYYEKYLAVAGQDEEVLRWVKSIKRSLGRE